MIERKFYNPLFKDVVELNNIGKFSNDMSELVNNPLLSDVTFEVGPECLLIHAHKVILCQRSQYFYRMFVSSGMRESIEQNPIIKKPDIDSETFLKVLLFIYSGRVHLSQSSTKDPLNVLAAADEMQISELKQICVEHIKQYIDTTSALNLLDQAYCYNCLDLVQCCLEFIKNQTKEVLQSDHLPYISRDTLFQLLDSEYLACDEVNVFRCMIRWGIDQLYQKKKEQVIDDEITPLDQEQLELLKKRESVPVRPPLTDVQSDECTSWEEEEIDNPPVLKRENSVFSNKKYMSVMTSFIRGADVSLNEVAHHLVEEDKIMLRGVLSDLLPLVRYPLMSSYELTDAVEPFQLLPDWLLLEAYRHMSAPERSIGSKRAQKRKGLSDIKTGMFDGSTILSEQHKQTIVKWYQGDGITKKKWVMQYKGTKDGFKARIFHELCDNKGPTMTICRTTEGYVFGGYNSQQWTSKNCWQAASDTFIFSLVNPYNDGTRKMKVKNPQRAIYNHESFGPTFGGGGISYFDPYDIYIDSSMTRGHTNVGNAYSTFRGGFRSDEAQKSLAGSLNAWTLNEIEVFVLG
ncbi:creD [Acrasis kona]|uniref:Btb/poz domain-containing protein n=1 Tax=Acrasis kona TaxID=1008807 RepID=A0AAW2YRW0_9EUKA